MVHVEVIKIISRLVEQGKSIREISRETGHHRSTVSKLFRKRD
ncbi:MAG: helix-turn-helix domain-containing protein [Candidatus Scalindua rubra]|nr:helix-turn-helix domain-containing protein [Candidatus Scalindua rubra]